jgi:hypothetical protein
MRVRIWLPGIVWTAVHLLGTAELAVVRVYYEEETRRDVGSCATETSTVWSGFLSPVRRFEALWEYGVGIVSCASHDWCAIVFLTTHPCALLFIDRIVSQRRGYLRRERSGFVVKYYGVRVRTCVGMDVFRDYFSSARA